MNTTVLLSSSRSSGVDIAASLMNSHTTLRLMLLDAAAVMARRDHPLHDTVTRLADQGVLISVDENACKRRGITTSRLNPCITMRPISEIADALLDTTDKVIWL